MKNNHTQLTRLAAISLCLVMCLSATIPSVAQAAGGEPNPSDYKWTVSTPASGHDSLLQWTLVTDDAPNLSRIVMVDGTLYATSRDGKFYSSDDGQAWTLLYDFPEEGDGANGMFLYYSHYWGRLFCAFDNWAGGTHTGNLYMSTDLGRSWTISDHIPHRMYLLHDGMDESPTGVLYYGQYGGSSYSDDGEYLKDYSYIRRSTDGGLTWVTETGILATHIHSVEVAHDGKIFASYGDIAKPPYTKGVMVKDSGEDSGVWKNVTWDSIFRGQAYGIESIGDYTFFGSDSSRSPTIMRYDGAIYEPSLTVQNLESGLPWNDICYEIKSSDGVIYALTFESVEDYWKGRWSIWASSDFGTSWYCIAQERETIVPVITSLAVEDGSPYGYAIRHGGQEVYRFNHLGKAGIDQLIYEGSFSSIGDNWSTSITLANSGDTIPLRTHWIRDPVITVTAKSLTNLNANGQLDTMTSITPTGNVTIELDPSEYVSAPTSLKFSGIVGAHPLSNRITISVPMEGASGKCLVVFDAKKDSSSDSFALYMRQDFKVNGADVYGKEYGMFDLTDEWRTYAWTPSMESIPDDVMRLVLILVPFNTVEQTAYIDNIRVYSLDPDEAAIMVPSGHSLTTELQASDVRVTIDGKSYDLGAGPFADGEVIGTIQLTGDYKDSIDISAYCDGAVTITIEGERIGYASGLLPIHTDGGVWLRGGNADSYLELYGTAAVAYAGAPNVISPTRHVIYQYADGDAFIAPTSLSLSSTAPVTVSVLDWDTRNLRLTASWHAGGEQVLTIGGLRSGSYLWYLDGVEQGEVKAGKDGTIALSYESTGLHTLSVGHGPDAPAPISDTIGQYAWLIVAAVGVLVLAVYAVAARHPLVLIVGIGLLLIAALLKTGVL